MEAVPTAEQLADERKPPKRNIKHQPNVFLGGSVVKNCLQAIQSQVQSLGQEDPLEKEMATHSSLLP